MNKTYKIDTLGCKVNSYESQAMGDILKKDGYMKANINSNPNVYIINTCAVTSKSESKSRKKIKRTIRENKNSIIVVVGCYSQKDKEQLLKIEGINVLLGTHKRENLLSYVEKVEKEKKQIVDIEDSQKREYENLSILNFDNQKRAFVKIQDGCHNFCSFCIIPLTRKNPRSRNKDDILNEIKILEEKGFLEIVLTGIHTGGYGIDLENYSFSDLLYDISKNIKKIKRIRISSIEINEVDDKVLDLIKNDKRFLNHLHIPIQSGSDYILDKMNRKYQKQFFVNKIKKIKEKINNISISSDIIVGFPNESEEHFNETLQTIKECGFSKLHVFPFSPRKNTPAYFMKNKINPTLIKKRVKKMMALSFQLEKNYNKRFINKESNVLFEKKIKNSPYMIGKTSNYIDFKTTYNKDLIGKIKKVKITKISDDNTLNGNLNKSD